MTTRQTTRPWTRLVALGLVFLFALPLIAGCGSKGDQTASAPSGTTAPPPGAMSATPPPMTNTPAAKPGMSNTKKAVIVLAGAALLYYLYKRHQAQQQAAGGAGANGSPQLYRSRNGGIYYRDAQHRAVWVTAPAQQMQVPASEVQQYAPDYSQYQGQPAPPAPAGYRTQSFSQLDPSLAGSGTPPGPQ